MPHFVANVPYIVSDFCNPLPSRLYHFETEPDVCYILNQYIVLLFNVNLDLASISLDGPRGIQGKNQSSVANWTKFDQKLVY